MATDTITHLTSEHLVKLIRQYEQKYIVYANNIVRDREVAKDIVYDCFAKIWETRNEIENTNISGLIFTILHNSCINYRRSAQRGKEAYEKIKTKERGVTEYYTATLESSNPEELFQDELMEIYHKQLAQLPEISQTIFNASRIHGKTYKEIAEQLDIPVKKVDREIQRIVILLRKCLKDYLTLLITFFIPFT